MSTLLQKSSKKSLIREYGEALLVALVLAFVIRTFVVQAYKIPSESMVETLLVGDHLLASKFAYGIKIPFTHSYIYRGDDPAYGDIIIFEYPNDPSVDYIKRVIGLPGETLSFKNGYTYVNGEKLDESYLPTQGITTLPDSMADKTFTVPEGCMFVMGDNRTGSNDSRLLGEPYIPIEAVQARMLVAISVGSDQSWQGVRWIG